MVKKNPPKAVTPDFEKIFEAAFAAGDNAKKSPLTKRVGIVEERLASIEPLLEQLQANVALGTKLTEYVDDLRAEQVFFNGARYAVGALAVLTVVGLATILGLAIFHPKSPLLAAPPLAITAFVVGLVSGIVLVLGSFTKGVFRSTTERHADGFLPPALEKAVEIMGKVAGKKD